MLLDKKALELVRAKCNLHNLAIYQSKRKDGEDLIRTLQSSKPLKQVSGKPASAEALSR